MAVYKVIQDVEAEDKILGPLTLKSLIYAAIAGLLIFINFRLLIAGGPAIVRFAIIFVLLFPMLLFGVLASPLGRDQPTEVWLLSRVRFLLKPRLRTWNQSGLSQLVTITVPKRLEKHLTKELSQTEVQSRLRTLASMLDSRGWATKNLAINAATAPSYLEAGDTDSDRLVGSPSLSQDISVIDLHASDDILDEQNNPTAQNFAALMQQADIDRKKNITDKIDAARADDNAAQASVDSTFLDLQPANGQTGTTIFVGRNVLAPGSTDDGNQSDLGTMTEVEKQLLVRKHREEAEFESKLPENLRPKLEQSAGQSATIKSADKPVSKMPAPAQPIPVTPEMQAAKLELAQSGNDLSVASIAHLANRKNQVQQIGPNEFVVALR